MRFNSRLTATVWLHLVCACIWVFLVFSSQRQTTIPRITACIYVLLVGFGIVVYTTSFWEISPTGLFERRLWAKKSIPLDSTTRVGPVYDARNNRVVRGGIQVNFTRMSPSFDLPSDGFEPGSMRLFPVHPDLLLTALRHAAPQATFEST